MAKPSVAGFLAEELAAASDPISYRLVSRKLGIHVNDAKNGLTDYYSANKAKIEGLRATFLITGLVANSASNDGMELDGEEEEDDAENFQKLRCAMVGADTLEDVLQSFASVLSCHVYSLSLSPPSRGHWLRGSTVIRELDASRGRQFLSSIGKIVSQNSSHPHKDVSPSKVSIVSEKKALTKPAESPLPTKTKTPIETPAPRPSPVAAKVKEEKPKASGKLDWSKAKPKELTAKSSKKAKLEEVPSTKAPHASPVHQPVAEPSEETKPKQAEVVPKQEKGKGKEKAKAEPNEPIVTTQPSARVKRGAVVSDDEDSEDSKPSKPTRRSKQVPVTMALFDSDEPEYHDKSLRAMMDLDDDEVEKVSNHVQPPVFAPPKVQEEEQAEPEADTASRDGDIAMDEDSDPAPKAQPKKRKPKKVIPKGRNGYEKKRIVKSRSKMDDKGYIITEDYSSYESMDEEEAIALADKKSKPKGKAKAAPKKAAESKDSDSEAPKKSFVKPSEPKAKPSGSEMKRRPSAQAGGNQKNLMNYFGGGGKSK